MLVDGKWNGDWQPVQAKDAKGGFVRQESSFRNWVTPDGRPARPAKAEFAAEAGRYHLYVALICPWASRTLIARRLKGLEGAIAVTVVEPVMTGQGWRFGDYPGSGPDLVNGATYLHEIYTRADPHYTGRATVPVLWDRAKRTIVNNKSADIVRMFNVGFGALAESPLDLYPSDIAAEINSLNDQMYGGLNKGSIAPASRRRRSPTKTHSNRCSRRSTRSRRGSPTDAASCSAIVSPRATSAPSSRSCASMSPITACSNATAGASSITRRCRLTCCAFSTGNGIRETVSIDHIKRGYYAIESLNPNGIVPLGPDIPGLTDRA